jgi:hypothetical protein
MSITNTAIANYQEEKQQYLNLLGVQPAARILLFAGESGSGKSTLLEHCLHDVDCPDTICRIVIDFKGGAVNLPKLFHEIGREVGWERLPNFQARLNSFDGTGSVSIDRNPMIGWGNRISVILSPEDQATRESRLAALSEDLRTDLLHLEQPVLIVLDSYEQATIGTREWLETHLLDWLDKVGQLRLLIAGQSVPEPGLKWRRLAQYRELRGIREPDHWLPVVQRFSPRYAQPEHLGWLAALCLSFEGRPSEIMKIIQALP